MEAAAVGWRGKPEAAASAATVGPRLARTRDITGSGGTDRANRPPKRPNVVISRHDHGSGGGGGWRAKSEIPGPITPPFMILKDFPEGLWKILHDHGSGGRGTTDFP